MSQIEHPRVSEASKGQRWKRYLIDNILAVVAILLISVLISWFQLYYHIPNITLVYLLIVLWIAHRYGLRAAILVTIVACLSLDFFLLHPFFSLNIAQVEEAQNLLLFLLLAIMISYIFSRQRERAREAHRREQEARTLYESGLRDRAEEVNHREQEMRTFYKLLQATNDEKDLKYQLNLIAQAIVDAFSFYGVSTCAILLPDCNKKMSLQTSAPQSDNLTKFSSDEEASIGWVMAHGQTVVLSNEPLISRAKSSYIRKVIVGRNLKGRIVRHSIRLVPLKAGQKVLGVLRLVIEDVSNPQLLAVENSFDIELELSDPQREFFLKLLDLAVSIIERTRIQQENLHIELWKQTEKLHASIISSISHDLRTPLSTIMGTATSLLQGGMLWENETERKIALKNIEREADRLDHFVDNLLDMSCIEGGALKPKKVLYVIDALILETIDYMQPLLCGRSIELDVPDLPPVELDPIRIGQVLSNLIENAVHYTPIESSIEIHARTNGEQMLISIADRGPGIKANDIERIFEKFYRSHPTYPPGSGLGLAVCRGLVEAHNGRIWAENRDCGGAIFHFTLPLYNVEGIEHE